MAAEADGLCFGIGLVGGVKQVIIVPVGGVGNGACEHLRLKVVRQKTDNESR
jgi:hypothetical protein